MQENKEKCINCQAVITGNFCQKCGQRANIRRISFGSLVTDIFSKWLGWDNRFFNTIRDLTIRPEAVFKRFLEGNRVRYVGPLGYIFLTTAIMILLFDLADLDLLEMMKAGQDSLQTSEEVKQSAAMQQMQAGMNQVVARYFRFISFILVPFLAFVARIFYARRSPRKNYLEYFVIGVFIAGHAIWFSIISIPLLKIFGFVVALYLSITTVVYSVYCLYRFQQTKGIRGVLLAISVYVISYAFFYLTLFIALIFYMVFFTDFIQEIRNSIPQPQ